MHTHTHIYLYIYIYLQISKIFFNRYIQPFPWRFVFFCLILGFPWASFCLRPNRRCWSQCVGVSGGKSLRRWLLNRTPGDRCCSLSPEVPRWDYVCWPCGAPVMFWISSCLFPDLERLISSKLTSNLTNTSFGLLVYHSWKVLSLIFLSIHFPLSLSHSVSVCPSVRPSVRPSASLSLSIDPSIDPPARTCLRFVLHVFWHSFSHAVQQISIKSRDCHLARWLGT